MASLWDQTLENPNRSWAQQEAGAGPDSTYFVRSDGETIEVCPFPPDQHGAVEKAKQLVRFAPAMHDLLCAIYKAANDAPPSFLRDELSIDCAKLLAAINGGGW